MKLYLTRHGEEIDADGVVHGYMDVPLSPHGNEQAQALAESMKGFGIKRIYTSDLTRAVQSAKPLSQALGIGMIPDERLRPIKLGEYEGQKMQDVMQNMKDWSDRWMLNPNEAIPGGDSFTSFQARNISFFKEVAEHCENDEPVAVFTHSRNCHLIGQWASNEMRPMDKGVEDLLHHCDHQLGTYRTYQIDRTSNLVRLTNAGGQKGKSFTMRFIEPGLVRYEDAGDVLVQKAALDEMAQSFVGCPVFDRTHKDTTDRDFTSGKADGIVVRVWNDPQDGWYWCEALVWDPDTLQHMKEGYGLSCAYDVMSWTDQEGTWHNIPYANEVKRGRYTHLAIVKRPRYEDVRIIANQGGRMKLKFWEKDKKPEDKASEVELANALVEVEAGKDVKLEDVIAGFTAEEKRKAELANANKKLGDDDTVQIGEGKITIKELKAGYAAHLKNEAENSMSQDHKDGKHKDKKMESCGYCSNEVRNAELEAAKAKGAEEMKNAIEKERVEKERLEALRNAAHKGEAPKMPEAPRDMSDRIRTGYEQYGPLPTSN